MLEIISFVALIFMLIRIAVIDIREKKISNRNIVALFFCAVLLSILLLPELLIIHRILGIFVASFPMLMMDIIRPGSFGGGDIKLMLAAGVVMGGELTIRVMTVAVLTAGCYTGYVLMTNQKQRKSTFAFGPFLCMGIATVFLEQMCG